MKKKTKCYIYTRVSTAIQVDGYSLDAQKDKLRKYTEFQDIEIVGEYSDEGHSGKNIKGRQEFMRMLNDIEDGIDSSKEAGKLLISIIAAVANRFGAKDTEHLDISGNGQNLFCCLPISQSQHLILRFFQFFQHQLISRQRWANNIFVAGTATARERKATP